MAMRCSQGKVCYATRQEAKKIAKAMVRQEKERTRLKGMMRKFGDPHPYHCNYCGNWHLASKILTQ